MMFHGYNAKAVGVNKPEYVEIDTVHSSLVSFVPPTVITPESLSDEVSHFVTELFDHYLSGLALKDFTYYMGPDHVHQTLLRLMISLRSRTSKSIVLMSLVRRETINVKRSKVVPDVIDNINLFKIMAVENDGKQVSVDLSYDVEMREPRCEVQQQRHSDGSVSILLPIVLWYDELKAKYLERNALMAYRVASFHAELRKMRLLDYESLTNAVKEATAKGFMFVEEDNGFLHVNLSFKKKQLLFKTFLGPTFIQDRNLYTPISIPLEDFN